MLPKSKDSSFSDKDKAGFYEVQNEKQIVTQQLIVTPLTNFSDVHSFLKEDESTKNDKFYVHNFLNNGSF